MLTLSRVRGEVIHIGDDITITVVDVDRGRCRIGIEAPKEVTILRHELYVARKESEKAVSNEN